jgi:8-oxo-dGTP pyrophosphatase MutT (NUDIX family)
VDGDDPDVTAALAAVDAALDVLRSRDDDQAKFKAFGDFAEGLRARSEGASAERREVVTRIRDKEKLTLAPLAGRVGISKTRLHQLVNAGKKVREPVSKPSTSPEPQAVVAAIVTSGRGVLVGRRNDGKPPWTFIAGEIEPGESPADAAVREVKEETGLRITAGDELGRRLHPKTGRWMVYIAATLANGSDAFVGDEDELAEVRWVSLAEADQLMGGTIFEPVHHHLSKTLEG